MNELSKPRRINVVALLVAAAGILIIFVSAPDRFPPVPPGPIILIIAAGLVAFAPGRFTPVVGVLVPLMILVGGVLSGALADILAGPENAGVFVGNLAQMAANLTAVVAGTIALAPELRSRTGSPAR